MTRPVALLLAVLLCAGGACTSNGRATATLRVLASAELGDMRPLLDDLREETGIELVLDHRSSVDATNDLVPGDYDHDLAWLSSDRYFQLRLAEAGNTDPPPLSTKIMTSPVVFGVRPEKAAWLRANAPDARLSWADIADAAATGEIRFGMADPRRSDSGLSALVGVATAAAGTGTALRPADVSCDRLRGFLRGQTLTAATSSQLVADFVAHQDDADAVIGYESVLLSLNAGGELREPLEIIYPDDGMVLAEYPMLLLDPARRADYDRVVSWLRSEPVQERIMAATLRRPVDPDVRRDPRLRPDIGNALYFPAQLEVIDKLLTNYEPSTRAPGHVIFLLDFSGSMKGERVAALRAAFDGLSGTDETSSGRFIRFYHGERFTLVRFGGQVLAEQSFTIAGQTDIDAMRAFLSAEEFDDHTAVWSALAHGYQLASQSVDESPGQPVTVVLMTDGVSNAGIGLDQFLAGHGTLPPHGVRAVHTYTVRLGDADPAELDRAARATGGRMVDATTTSLHDAVKEIRGCT